jgi:disulfide bond formation protein DsbB
MIKSLSIILSSLAVLALCTAYTMEFFGILPCKLCIYQRYVYYAIFFVSFITFWISLFHNKNWLYYKLLLICILTVGLSLAIFQVLVEKQIIRYQSTCVYDEYNNINSIDEYYAVIEKTVPCDIPQGSFLYLSIAEWNLIYILFIILLTIKIYSKIKT